MLVPPRYIDPSKCVFGVDLYHLSRVSSLHAAKAAGIEFAWIKCGESTNVFDEMHDELCERCDEAGIIVGSYWFVHADRPGAAQASLLARRGRHRKGDLINMMDLETMNGDTPSQVGACGAAFEAQMRSLTGRGAIAYASQSFLEDNVIPTLGGSVNYNAARYGRLPTIASKFVQFADGQNVTVDVPGLGQPVDVDLFWGTLEELVAGFTY